MTRPVLVDLDDAGTLDRLWSEVERHRSEESEVLRSGYTVAEFRPMVARRIDEAERDGRITADRAAELREDLHRFHPSAVASACWREVHPDRILHRSGGPRTGPVLGPSGPQVTDEVPGTWAWVAADPSERLPRTLAELRSPDGRIPVSILEAVVDFLLAEGVDGAAVAKLIASEIGKVAA